DRANTNTGDYVANRYSTGTPGWVTPDGPVLLRLVPPPPAPAEGAARRVARLHAGLAAVRCRLARALDAGRDRLGTAGVGLIARPTMDDRGLRASMFRQGRGVRPLGLRNGIRATVYPISQTARRLRGG